MTPVLQSQFPPDMILAKGLPGIAPVTGDWIVVDDAYAGQMALRADLLHARRGDVLFQPERVLGPACELLRLVLAELPRFGFHATERDVRCPDKRIVPLDWSDPLATLGHLLQCDFCLHEKVGDEHVLSGAVLCFPASWTLSEKAGKPLSAIHRPVAEYDANLARRVQRMFDGVQIGKPIWRFNQLWYDDPALFSPRLENAPHRQLVTSDTDAFFRSERQTLFRLPLSRWVVFAIHTVIVSYRDAPAEVR